MRAWLELVECSGTATCSLRLGERLSLPVDRDAVLGRTPECDIVMTSNRQGGRRNCAIRSCGTHHELVHCRHHGAIFVAGHELRDGVRELRDGDEIVPGDGLRLRYVVDRGDGAVDAGFDTALAVAGPYVVFDRSGDTWRCVPIDDPAAPPRRLLGITGPDPLRRWRRALAAGGGTTAVRASWDDGDRRLVVVDDVAGVHLEDLLERGAAQGGQLDAAFVAALLRPSLHTLVSTRVDVFIEPRSWCVTFDGDVVFDGFVLAALSGLPHFVPGQAVGQEVVELVADLIRSGAAIPSDAVLLQGPLAAAATPAEARALTALQRLHRFVDDQPPVPASAWRGLLAGLFPHRVARERELRERLGLLDAATIARLPAR